MLNFLFSWKCYISLLIVGFCGWLAVPFLDKAKHDSAFIDFINIVTMAAVMGIAIYAVLAIWVILFKTIKSSRN
ncbi:putative membrane protein [Campylobacter blaseri]|uniref:ATP-binding protein n=1 Tax=Campylobacter blaseri TaxID=2042961 RepID=A0A2P8QYI0_9BACT|nr:ATP-binding protein [Campylobacter blaseri]PSM51323.1 ATP-binding protein [Campylobacter blaseri]PSM52467.1 ATP-binding protein [Campylobacter blaseri]QKF86201.1 putative membrane protein [Campylobacter blaseri]